MKEITVHYEPAQTRHSMTVELCEFDGCETEEDVEARLQELVDEDASRNMVCYADSSAIYQIMDMLESENE